LAPLNLFGLVAVALMILFDTLERKHRFWGFWFGVACWMGSAYGFLSGAWPFGLLEALWGCLKFWAFGRLWWITRHEG
jgi:hypothetical protein